MLGERVLRRGGEMLVGTVPYLFIWRLYISGWYIWRLSVVVGGGVMAVEGVEGEGVRIS